MSNEWNAVIAADLKDAEGTGGYAPIADGTYDGYVRSLEAITFRAGSKGVKVTYAVVTEPGKPPREINDYFVIIPAAGGQPNRVGPASLKKLMMECGLTSQEVQNFTYPAFDSKAFGDFIKLLEKPLTLEIKLTEQKKGQNAGKSFSRVRKVSQRVKQAA